MIEFRCKRCGEDLESPSCLAGKIEICPVCKSKNLVPASQPSEDSSVPPAPIAAADNPPQLDSPPNGTVPPNDPPGHASGLPKATEQSGGDSTFESFSVELGKARAEFKQAEAEFQQAEAELKQAEAKIESVKQDRHLAKLSRRESGSTSRRSALGQFGSEIEKALLELEEAMSEEGLAKAQLTQVQAKAKMVERAAHFTEILRAAEAAAAEVGRRSMPCRQPRNSPADPSIADQEYKVQSCGQECQIPGVRAVTVQGRIVEYRTDDGWWFYSAEEAIAHLPRLRAEARRAAVKNGPKRQGECSRCGKAHRSLRETEDKHWICLNCVSELYPALATKGKIQHLRSVGFTVPDELTEKECQRLWLLHYGRKLGLSLPDDTPLADLLRLDEEESLTQRAQSALAAEHERHVNEEIERRSEHLPPVRHFFTSVVGVTFDNNDGSSRQEIIATCKSFQPLHLEHEEHNPHDANAIAVRTENGRQIGYLPRDVASDVWWRMQHRFTYAAIAADINQRTKDHPTIGMNILILVARPGVSQEQMQAYLDGIKPDVVADVLAGPRDDCGEEGREEDDDEPEQGFTMRGGTMVPVDEVFCAWTSRDIPRMVEAMDLKTNPIDRHFLLLNIVTETYGLRANPEMAELCLRVAQTHLTEFPKLLPFLNQEFPDRLPQVQTFQHYAAVLVERNRFREAIQVCKAAIGFGLQDGTKGGYEGRIVRIKKQQERKMKLPASDHSCGD